MVDIVAGIVAAVAADDRTVTVVRIAVAVVAAVDTNCIAPGLGSKLSSGMVVIVSCTVLEAAVRC